MLPEWAEVTTHVSMRGRPSVLISHATGNQNVRNAVRSLAEQGMLAEYWTALAWNPPSLCNRVLPAGLRAHLARRAFPEIPARQVRTVPWREMVRLTARSTPLHPWLCSGERPFSIIGMCRHFDGRVARRLGQLRPDVVYAYEGAALQTYRQARRHGVIAIHEHTSSHWDWARRLMAEEAERNPEYAGLLPALSDFEAHLEWKSEELRLADYVFVPSQHVRRTLAGVVDEEKMRVVRYGAPPVRPRRPIHRDPARPLQVLFVGNLGQHKGIGYLLQAMDRVEGQVELTLVGNRLRPNPHVDAACRRWRWLESLPHAQVMEQMQQADVLVLPSLAEAFGLVVTEALASGLPVIVTPNAGASELLHDGQDGFVVPVGDAQAIAERLTELSRDREKLAEMSRQAQRTAAARSWDVYRAEWAEAVRGVQWQ